MYIYKIGHPDVKGFWGGGSAANSDVLNEQIEYARKHYDNARLVVQKDGVIIWERTVRKGKEVVTGELPKG